MAKIAFLCQPGDEVVPPMQRGSSVAIIAYQLARRVAGSNRVVLFAKRGRGQSAVERDPSGMEIRRVFLPTKSLHRLLDVLMGVLGFRRPFFASPLYYFSYVLRFSIAARRERFDVIHIATYSQYAALLKALDPRARIVLHMHGDALSQLDRDRMAGHLRHVELVLGCSDDVRDKIRRRFPEHADRCETIHNGVDVDHFTPADDRRGRAERAERRVLFVGRVSPEKGVHVLMEAASRLLARFPDARLDIVGSTGMLPYPLHVAWSSDPEVSWLARFYGVGFASRLRQQLMGLSSSYVSELRRVVPEELAERAHFLGAVDHAKLLDAYRSADVFVFPSVWPEPFGMPTAEALAQSMGAAGRRRALARFSWDRVAGDLLGAYEGLLAQRPEPAR